MEYSTKQPLNTFLTFFCYTDVPAGSYRLKVTAGGRSCDGTSVITKHVFCLIFLIFFRWNVWVLFSLSHHASEGAPVPVMRSVSRRPLVWRSSGGEAAEAESRAQAGAYLWAGTSSPPPPSPPAAGGSWGPVRGPRRTPQGRRHGDPGTAGRPLDENKPAGRKKSISVTDRFHISTENKQTHSESQACDSVHMWINTHVENNTPAVQTTVKMMKISNAAPKKC